jgi:hypothetical protein
MSFRIRAADAGPTFRYFSAVSNGDSGRGNDHRRQSDRSAIRRLRLPLGCVSDSREFLDGFGGQRLATNALFAAGQFRDFYPGDASHVLAFDRDYGVNFGDDYEMDMEQHELRHAQLPIHIEPQVWIFSSSISCKIVITSNLTPANVPMMRPVNPCGRAPGLRSQSSASG